MTKYLEDGAFSVSLGTENYRNNWDAVFAKKDTAEQQPEPVKQDTFTVSDQAWNEYITALVREGQRHPLYKEIEAERLGQDTEHGGPDHDDQHSPADWESFIKDHLKRAMTSVRDATEYRKRLICVAALAVAAIEVHDRKVGKDKGP